jgi:hypothetical protein
MASRSVTVCSRLRDARGPVSPRAAPVDRLLHGGDDEPLAELGHAAVAELDDLGEVVARVDVHERNGKPPGAERLLGERSSTIESLPPLKSSTGRSSSAATSRMTWIASLSRVSR